VQTELAAFIRDTPEGREADAILRKCVHCGFCSATCPTYQLLGDELDSPRGRIYLIKQALEGAPVTASTRLHLDRCLTCRACESTCPSGVQYGRLADIGRAVVEERVPRGPWETAKRAALDVRPPRVDQRAHVVAAVLLMVEVKAQGAAAARACRLDERDAHAVEHARGRRVDARRERRLHAARQREHAPRVPRSGPRPGGRCGRGHQAREQEAEHAAQPQQGREQRAPW